MMYATLPLVALGAILFMVVRRHLARRTLLKIRGPPSPSFLLGHTEVLDSQFGAGAQEKAWSEEYGTAWRIKGCLGEDSLVIADPKALQYIYHKSGYHFPKTAVVRQLVRELTGKSIAFVTDSEHARFRRIMNPAFSAGQLRSFLPLFLRTGRKLTQKWNNLFDDTPSEGQKIDVLSWLTRCMLDGLGEAAFDINCGALDDSLHPVVQAYRNMFTQSLSNPTKFILLFRSFWNYIPMSILRFVRYLPTKDHAHFRRTLDKINGYAKAFIGEKADALLAGKNTNKRDIMNILVSANATEDPNSRLTEDEMVSQVASFMLAGHDTSALTLTWLLYELAQHPEHQDKMREEIRTVRARVAARGESGFSMSDLESMTYVVAAMKEGIRLDSIVYVLVRMSTRDEVIPLSYPITTAAGEPAKEIAVPAGTELRIAVRTYNRLPQVWGPDADRFNPQRFIDKDKLSDTHVGVTSNLMTFGAGLQGCIGWKFAMIEMQAILVELLEHFKFALPEDGTEITHLAAGLVFPAVKGDINSGVQLPLQVSPI